ncbi:MAG: TadE/TadG family type IV pilus assembly protein [Chloroflexota bacterium]
MGKRIKVAWADQAGQSLIEVAFALPLLLVLFLGLVDGARAYYYAGVVANAAREGVNYAARNASATRAQVTQRACDATGLAAFGSPCPGLTVTCTVSGGDAIVEARYNFALITASIVEGAFKLNPIPIRADSRFPLLTVGTPCAS